MVSLPGRCDGHPAGSVGACQISADSACNIGEAVAPNAIMGWTVFQPRREQWTRQRYQLAPPESLRSRPQLENRARTRREAKAVLFEYIEVFYNRQRRHSSVGYRTPASRIPHAARARSPNRLLPDRVCLGGFCTTLS